MNSIRIQSFNFFKNLFNNILTVQYFWSWSLVKKDNHPKAKRMFDSNISSSFYKAFMCYECFIFLVNCLRFDVRETSETRKGDDPFAHIRKIWEIFIESCRTLYTPSSYLTIDEQILGFHLKCISLKSHPNME